MSDQSEDSTRRPLSDDQRDHLERRALERARRKLSGEEVPNSLDDSDGAYLGDSRTTVERSSSVRTYPTDDISEYRKTKNQHQKVGFAVGDRQSRIICPYCQTRGSVHTYEHKIEEGGPSMWSVLLAPFSYGLSLLFGWKSSKYGTSASCSNCGVSWRTK
jgi:hypothetical protein